MGQIAFLLKRNGSSHSRSCAVIHKEIVVQPNTYLYTHMHIPTHTLTWIYQHTHSHACVVQMLHIQIRWSNKTYHCLLLFVKFVHALSMHDVVGCFLTVVLLMEKNIFSAEPTNMLDMRAVLWLENYLVVSAFLSILTNTYSLNKHFCSNTWHIE